MDILKSAVDENKRKGISHIVIANVLKETLQYYVMNYIYNGPYGQNLLFTGGSCLRFCFGLNRLSEDLDLDWEEKEVDREELAQAILKYFRIQLQMANVEYAVKGKGEKLYLKFPILGSLGLSGQGFPEKLFVKVEIEQNASKHYGTDLSPVSRYDLNFIVRHYDLPTLMASKIAAVLGRTFKKGHGDRVTFKGRDYYDLFWYLQKGVKPNMERVEDLTGISSAHALKEALKEKVHSIHPPHLKEDLLPLFEDGTFVENYVLHYQTLTLRALDFPQFF